MFTCLTISYSIYWWNLLRQQFICILRKCGCAWQFKSSNHSSYLPRKLYQPTIETKNSSVEQDVISHYWLILNFKDWKHDIKEILWLGILKTTQSQFICHINDHGKMKKWWQRATRDLSFVERTKWKSLSLRWHFGGNVSRHQVNGCDLWMVWWVEEDLL